MLKKLIHTLAVVALLVCVCAPAQAQANVSSAFVDGNLVFYDKSGNIVFTIDGTNRKLTIPTGSALSVAGGSALTVRASTNIGVGDLLYLSSYNATDGFIAAIADADVAGGDAAYVATAAITSGSTGSVYRAATVTMDTQGSTVGNPVYLTITGTTTNTLSLSAPSGADDRTQIVGRVISVAASGTVAVNLDALPVTIITGTQIRDESIASADILDGTIVAADIATSAVATAEILDGTIIADDIATGGVATAEILDGTILNADIDATAAIARSKLAEDALQIYGIPIASLRSDAGAALLAAETAGTFDVTVGTNTILANGEVTDNETEVSVAYFQFVLPAEYVAAGDVTIRLPAALIKVAAAVNNGSTLDIEVYEQSDAGAVGADINSTAAATFAADDTWYNKDFVITATDLVAGDVLNVKITASVVDSEAGGGTLVLNLAPPKVLIDIKG